MNTIVSLDILRRLAALFKQNELKRTQAKEIKKTSLCFNIPIILSGKQADKKTKSSSNVYGPESIFF